MEKATPTKIFILIVQLCLFALGRLMDDISWYDVNIDNEVNVCKGIRGRMHVHLRHHPDHQKATL